MGEVKELQDRKRKIWFELLIHVILGSSEYSGIKTATKPQVGQPSEPSQNLHIWDGQWCPQGRKSLAPMSFFVSNIFFPSGWGSDSATGNIVTQYYLPHGQMVSICTGSPTSSTLVRGGWGWYVTQQDEKQNLSKGRWPSCEPTASMHQVFWSTKGTVGQTQSGCHPLHPTVSPAVSTDLPPDN